ncbi:predicted protein [Naegleria gruberi]|uniref:Predicted protein n=1 Tax=Naegleria gruberi TaxID=5762 RepID=D2W134_NAEGR|nr:uncharacterized protein NAEGRDRAFT_75073 [Naegleria gruberi]EFC37292.1 predicted protein [Naegleria gruberi]|eukprot:XP_002670036.1 predicted protein [Naegleria gruberi strain NEG-M]
MISSSTLTSASKDAKPVVKKVSEMNDEELLNEELELTEEELKEFGDDEDLKPYIKVKQEEQKKKKALNSSSSATTTTTTLEQQNTTTSNEEKPKVLPPNPSFVPTILYVI